MTKGLNIVSRLTFENIPDGTLPTSIPDENQYSNYSYTKVGTVTVETIDEIKFIKLNSTNAKIYFPLIITDQSKKNFQAEFDVIFDSLKVDTHLVSIGTTTLASTLRVVASSNPAQGLRLINGNNQISSYYRFENNKKYTICVGFKDNVISMYVNGTIIGYLYSEEFVNSLNVTTPSNIILGAPLNNTNDTNLTLYGKLGNINISSGPSVKHEESYTKYGTNLVSFLNFENLAGIGTYKTGVEAVYNGIEWRGVESATYSNGYGNIKNISADLTGDFTVMFSLKKFKVANANILKYGNYSVDYVAGFIPVPEPDVIVNEYTTAALNFENGLIDQVGTTIWQKEGTADVASANKIFGENSFETKALGDSLYTNSKVITGGSTPFTIEFYALIKGSSDGGVYKSLLSKVYNGPYAGQGFTVTNNNRIQFQRQEGSGSPILTQAGIYNKSNNEIIKYTFTYDGSALRIFHNDKLDLVAGTPVGFYMGTDQPMTFMSLLLPSAPVYNSTTYGLIDNINIHDGIATKVRDPDPYEEYLVVDLAFDGENNSTKIVDNARLKERNEIKYNDNVVSLLHFNDNINDEVGNRTWSITGSSYSFIDGKFSRALDITGENNIIQSDNITEFEKLSNSQNFTVEYWVKLNSDTNGTIVSRGKNGSTLSYSNTISLTDVRWIQYKNGSGSSGVAVSASYNFSINEWYHIAIVGYTDYNREIFINGESIVKQQISSSWYTNSNDPLRIGSLDYLPSYAYWFKGSICEFRITNGVARYTENFTPPTEPSDYIPKNNWTVNGNAKISTDQKFDGFSSLYLDGTGDYLTTKYNDNFNWIGDYTISFNIILKSESVTKYILSHRGATGSSTGLGIVLSSTNTITIIAWDVSGNTVLLGSTNKSLSINRNYKIDIIKSNMNWSIYIDGVLDVEIIQTGNIAINTNNDIFIGRDSSTNYQPARDFNGYIKNFKIYKDVAIIPEDPIGKIQLEFDNNVVDKYGNSTWTNNGVTFDQVNSVKGHAAYFGSSNQRIYCGQNDNLNFGNNNFLISLDMKQTELRQYATILCSNSSVTTDGAFIGVYPNGTFSTLVFGINGGIQTGTYGSLLLNNFYNINLSRKNGVVLSSINGVINGALNVSSLINYNHNNGTQIGHGWSNAYSTNKYVGYIDNFKSIKNPQEQIVIDRPAIHLPLETNATNIGFAPLTINSVGSPTYTTIDGKKCIKFESGKYLTINSNNIFNLGENSDFYIEMDVYIPVIHVGTNGHGIFGNNTNWDAIGSNRIEIISMGSTRKTKSVALINRDSNNIQTVLESEGLIIENSWNNIVIRRTRDTISISVNDIVSTFQNSLNIDYSKNGTHFGQANNATGNTLDGYMSNFKMFVGTSEIPETYNDKKVLDLDFKPTRKSYLFKDNNNKCVIHPVNITQRDYQDSQYCCTFNGTNQYLQLGKNDLLNFGNDDFVIEVNFKVLMYDNWSFILSNNISSGADYFYFAVAPNDATGGKLFFSYNYSSTNYFQIRSTNKIPLNEIINVKIVRNGQDIKMYINDTDVTDISFSTVQLSHLNLNAGNNTKIGSGSSTFKGLTGYIYSIKVFRNTTDLSLLEDENTDVIHGDTTLTLSNGTDSQEVIFDNKVQNNFRFVHSNDSTKLIVNEQILEVPNVENTSNELSLFTDFDAEAKDIKTYNIAFEDEDTFSGNVPIHTQFGEIEEINTLSDEFIVVDQGDFIVNGFFEGRPEDSRYQIQNRFDKFIVHTGSGPFNYNGLNERFIDDYEIYLPDTKETMPIPTETMIRGYITISITPTECEGVNFGVKVFRRSDNKLIGIYDFNNYVCTIDNLDCNKRYDCIIFDKDVNLESRCLSNRTPLPY